MVKSLKTITIFTLAITALIITGCAKVRVNKVPTPTQYVEWTDKMQHKADKMEGIRFYLPRPFINVFESFPIRTDIYIADGVVSPDKKYVLIKTIKPESGLSKYVAGIPSMTRIPNRYIKPLENKDIQDVKDIADAHAKLNEEIQKNAEIAAKTTIPTGASSETEKTASSQQSVPDQQVTGINSRKVSNDNGAFAFQPLRGNFDIIYMPDFEEQYAVKSRAGLGNAQFELNLGQGWSLQGFNSISDNSELNKRMYDLIDSSIQLAKSAASAAVGVPPGLPAGAEEILKPHGGGIEKEEGKDSIPYSPVSLKIIVVHYAAKGIYPVIKPRELQERMTSKLAASGGFNYVLDLFRSFPSFLGISDYDPTSIQRAQQAVSNETGKFTVPRYPYQYISFNTFRYMAIELIKEGDKPFEHLYDKTGTQGDPGDRQTADSGNLIYRQTSTPENEEDKDGKKEKNIEDLLNKQENTITSEISKAIAKDENLKNYVVQKIELESKGENKVDVDVIIDTPMEHVKQFKDTVKSVVENNFKGASVANINKLTVNSVQLIKFEDIEYLKSNKNTILGLVQNDVEIIKLKADFEVDDLSFEINGTEDGCKVGVILKSGAKRTNDTILKNRVVERVNSSLRAKSKNLLIKETDVEIKS